MKQFMYFTPNGQIVLTSSRQAVDAYRSGDRAAYIMEQAIDYLEIKERQLRDAYRDLREEIRYEGGFQWEKTARWSWEYMSDATKLMKQAQDIVRDGLKST